MTNCWDGEPQGGGCRRVEAQQAAPRLSTSRLPDIGVRQIGFENNVGAERLRAQPFEWRELEIRRDGEGDARLARNFGRIEEKKFVDDAREERGAVERRARFEKDA